jgi:outer membrane lipoprotein-sorting protein
MMRKLAIASLLIAGVALSGSVFAQAAASSAPAAASTMHKAHTKSHKAHKKMTIKKTAAPATASTAG